MTAALLMAATTAGCGDSSDDTSKGATSTKPKQAERTAPAALVGTYSMTLKRGDLPANPPPELTDQAERWTLKIANTGGLNNGPALTLINEQLGPLESSRFGVIADRILLHEEECAVAPGPVESEYTWKRRGNILRFTAVKNGCKDEVALTLLTAEPWTKRP